MVVMKLTGLLTLHVYAPASLRLAGFITREPPEMVILESPVMTEPPLRHWTVISVPPVHVHLRDTFLPSTACEGTNRFTPATASMERAKYKYIIAKSCKSRTTEKTFLK